MHSHGAQHFIVTAITNEDFGFTSDTGIPPHQ
jgi:hypothetical protein